MTVVVSLSVSVLSLSPNDVNLSGLQYTTLATACIEAGQEALAEQMLDERDYL
jgi:hypothetical protein